MTTLTQWFDKDVKPARRGVYERKHPTSTFEIYSYWTGKYWLNWSFDIDRAAANAEYFKHLGRFYISDYSLPWRGLVKP